MFHDNINLVLSEYDSNSKTFELPPGIYSSHELSEALPWNFQKGRGISHSIKIENDDLSMIAKLAVNISILARWLDENPVLSTNLGFTPHWYYKRNYKYVGEAKDYFTQKFILNRCAISDEKTL